MQESGSRPGKEQLRSWRAVVRAGEERPGHSPGVSERLTPVARALPIHFHFSLSLRKTEFRGGTEVVTSLVDHTGNEGRVPCSSRVQNPSSHLDREGRGPLGTLSACRRQQHLLRVRSLPPTEELGYLCSPDEPWEEQPGGRPCGPQSCSGAVMSPGSTRGRGGGGDTGKLRSGRHHVLSSNRTVRILSSFPLSGIKEKTNSKGFTREALNSQML